MKNPLRSILLIALAFIAGLSLTACSPGGKSVIGRWKVDRQDVVVTFTKDGEMINQTGGKQDASEYSISDGVLYVKPKDMPMSLRYSMSFPSDTEMVLTPQPTRGVQASDTGPMRLVRIAK